MYLFYTNDIRGDFAWFSEEETKHCLQVLRHQVGATIQFFDGVGGRYKGEIHETAKRHFVVKISERKVEDEKAGGRLHVAVAPTKNIDRFEWFMEKATELGVDEITPILCEHSERKSLRAGRLEKILLTASKQSLRARLPVLHDMISFGEFLKKCETTGGEDRYIAHCRSSEIPHFKDNCRRGRNVIVVIGPEGDFSDGEVVMAGQSGFQSVSLGKARLRTETAAIAACHIVQLVNE
ncbi:MAG: 16S rRNA (uracil(1498)-N(3))-methyltransferase [Saprospiraceae bacterium]|nr:MAG: 16S rRNA (uracil(1498)-N(3))-methyltransferase [Saprospiraceae bacterium]